MLAIDGAVPHFNLIFVRYLFVFTVKSKLSSKTLRTFLMKDDSWLNSQQKENTSLYFISVKIKLNCRTQALLLNYFDIRFILVCLKLESILTFCFYTTSTHDMAAYNTCTKYMNHLISVYELGRPSRHIINIRWVSILISSIAW